VQTGKLIRLTQAHTRFVLLLQSIVHSSPYPIPPDPPGPVDDYANSSYGILNGSTVGIAAGPPPRIPSRDLVFPAPLAYPVVAPPSHSKSAPRIPASANPYTSSRPRPTTTSPNDNYDSPARNRRLSLLSKNGGRASMPPPPPEEPRAMKMYSDTWRKRSSIRLGPSAGLAHGRSFSLDQVNPHMRRSNNNLNAAHQNGRSSRSSDSISSFYAPSPPFAFPSNSNRISHTPSPPPIFRPPSPSPFDSSPTPQTIHALRSSLSRLRAPILRVFVPTHSLTPDALEACERQLQDAGAWEHMSVGDVVCNFGYVPTMEPPPDPEPLIRGTGANRAGGGRGGIGEFGDVEGYNVSSSGSDDSLLRRSQSQNQGRRWSSGSVPPPYPPIYQPQQQTSSWLLFDGEILIPYTPPDLLHIPNPLSLPSPFYYSHLLAQHLNLNPNPRFVLDRLPIFAPILPQPAHAHGPRHQHSHSYSYGQGNGNGNGNAHTPTGIHAPQPPPKGPPTPPPKPQQGSSNPYANHLSTRQFPPLPPLPSDKAQKRPLPPTPQLPSQSFYTPTQTQTTPMAMTQITLTQTTSKVPSPLSPTGYLPVKQFVWTGAARVIASHGFLLPLGLGPPPLPQSQNQSKNKYSNANFGQGQGQATAMVNLNATAAQNAEQALGSAWHGTWVFEVEGTKEGHEMLLSLLAGRMPSLAGSTAGTALGGAGKVLIAQGKQGQGRAGLLCEVVRERSGGGVLWIR